MKSVTFDWGWLLVLEQSIFLNQLILSYKSRSGKIMARQDPVPQSYLLPKRGGRCEAGPPVPRSRASPTGIHPPFWGLVWLLITSSFFGHVESLSLKFRRGFGLANPFSSFGHVVLRSLKFRRHFGLVWLVPHRPRLCHAPVELKFGRHFEMPLLRC